MPWRTSVWRGGVAVAWTGAWLRPRLTGSNQRKYRSLSRKIQAFNRKQTWQSWKISDHQLIAQSAHQSPSLDYPDVCIHFIAAPLIRLFYYVHSIQLPPPLSSTELRLHFAPSDPHECHSSSSPKLSGVHLTNCSHLSILQRIPLSCRSSRSSHWRYEHRGKDCLPRTGSLGRP